MYLLRLLYSAFFSHPEVTAAGLALIAVASYIAYRRARKGARVTKYFVGFIVCTVLLVVTTSKLYTMYQLTGRIGGASTVTQRVSQKWDDYSWNSTTKRYEHTYWVSWTDQNIHEPGTHRANLTYDRWSRLRLADPIEVTYVPGDPTPYVQDGIFLSEGNFLFDYVLLFAELAGAAWFMMRMLRSGNSGGKGSDSEAVWLSE